MSAQIARLLDRLVSRLNFVEFVLGKTGELFGQPFGGDPVGVVLLDKGPVTVLDLFVGRVRSESKDMIGAIVGAAIACAQVVKMLIADAEYPGGALNEFVLLGAEAPIG